MLFSSLFNVSPTQWNVDKCLRYYLKYLWHRMTGCEWTERQRNIEAIPIRLFHQMHICWNCLSLFTC